jgi:signal transduction histidine kinase
MRRRLAVSYVLLLILVLVALEVPLAFTWTTGDSQRMALDRLGDAVRFAALAEDAFRNNESQALQNELDAYFRVHGIRATVINRERGTEIAVPAGLTLTSREANAELDRALAGEQTDGSGTVWPWDTGPMIVAAPIGRGGETLGAVVTISPTHELRMATLTRWSALAVGGLLALAVSILAALSLARWTLKPVAKLDAAVHHIAQGDYAARVPPHGGPPELRRLAGAFNDMVGTVADLMERQRSFVSHASHQLRNPLTALRLRVEDLSEAIPGEEGQFALQETDRLCQVLDSLLALASAERGRFGLETVDADTVAADRVTGWQPLAQQRGVTLRHEPAGQALKVRAVTTAVDQTLDALIDNGLKFGGSTVVVTVRPEGEFVAVRVVDDGPGLTEDQRRQATERFWRAPTDQNAAGSGLGLPIVAVLVETSGGRLELRAAEPHGLDAVALFPREG